MRNVTAFAQVKARVPRVEKASSEEWSGAKGNGAKASAPAKPDLDDEELQVSQAAQVFRAACTFVLLSFARGPLSLRA